MKFYDLYKKNVPIDVYFLEKKLILLEKDYYCGITYLSKTILEVTDAYKNHDSSFGFYFKFPIKNRYALKHNLKLYANSKKRKEETEDLMDKDQMMYLNSICRSIELYGGVIYSPQGKSIKVEKSYFIDLLIKNKA